MSEKRKSTITDVAKAAGVALGTVSRVLNNHADVNEAIRERVWEAARKLNYQRIRQRRTSRKTDHRSAQAGHIAVIFFGMEDTLVHLPVVSSALQGIETATSAAGRDLMLANIPGGDRIPPFLSEGRVEGLILKGPNQGLLPEENQSELLRRIYRVPHVWLMGKLTNARGDHCNFDTEMAGRIAADHLHSKGHRRVAFFNPKPGQNQFERVKAAFLGHALRLGCEVTRLEVIPPENYAWPLPAITNQGNVDTLIERWLAIPDTARPTAFFVPSDRTAVQVYSAFDRRGLRVGRDISVLSCNNERPLIMNLHPGLSSIDVHAEFTGHRAVDQLLWRIRNPHEPVSVQVLVEPTLVERESIASL